MSEPSPTKNLGEYSDTQAIHAHFCPNFQPIYQHEMSSLLPTEFTISSHNHPLLKGFSRLSIVELLMLHADCSLLALKPAHFSRYLPTGSETRRSHYSDLPYEPGARLRAAIPALGHCVPRPAILVRAADGAASFPSEEQADAKRGPGARCQAPDGCSARRPEPFAAKNPDASHCQSVPIRWSWGGADSRFPWYLGSAAPLVAHDSPAASPPHAVGSVLPS